jgi:lysophospholipase L1-like esterase
MHEIVPVNLGAVNRGALVKTSRSTLRATTRVAAIGLFAFSTHVLSAQTGTWIASWAASPEKADPNPKDPMLKLQDQTVRERVQLSVGGSKIRLRLSNEFGTTPLQVNAVTVAIPVDSTSVRHDSIRSVMFGGHLQVRVPAGRTALSDPVAFSVPDGAQISLSLYLPKSVATSTWHRSALKHAVVSVPGDHTHEDNIAGGADSTKLIFASAVLVPAKPTQRVLVVMGDSIVDGIGSTVDADRSWPSDLARRLSKLPEASRLAVVNEGIAGNRLLGEGPLSSLGQSVLARFDRDALSVPGVTHVILLEGINDIGFPGAKLGDLLLADAKDVRSAEDLIGAYRQLIAGAHARGVKLIGCTLTPYEGVDIPDYYSEEKEAVRQAVNQWIRTASAFDGVIDLDALLRDPKHPTRLLPRFASEDNLHPNDDGYQAMADATDLALFK